MRLCAVGGRPKNPYKAIVAGALSGAVEAVISYPTEFVKTQLQLFEDKAKIGPMQCARETVKKDGACTCCYGCCFRADAGR